MASMATQASNSAVFSFTRPKTKVLIQNRTGVEVQVKLASTTALTDGGGDFILTDGQIFSVEIELSNLVLYTTATLVNTAGATKNIYVKGWD